MERFSRVSNHLTVQDCVTSEVVSFSNHDVLAWFFIRVDSAEDLRSALVQMKDRYQMHNFGVLKALYADRPDEDTHLGGMVARAVLIC